MTVIRERKAVSIVDVARKAGVTKSTVSKALAAPSHYGDVSQATRERIAALARQMGYEPDWSRRARAQRRTRTIGLAFADTALPADETSGGLAHALARRCAQLDYQLAYVPLAGGPERWRRRIVDQGVDALVLVPPALREVRSLLADTGLPTVALNLATGTAIDHLLLDEADAAQRLVGHLAMHGHRRIAYAAQPRDGGHYSERERIDAVRSACRASGLAFADLTGSFQDLDRRLSKDGATAVIAYNIHDALRAMRTLLVAGLRIPQDISLCAWDDWMMVEHTVPSITTVAAVHNAVAQAAVDRLDAMLHGRAKPPAQAVVHRFPLNLAIRESTGPAPANRKPS